MIRNFFLFLLVFILNFSSTNAISKDNIALINVDYILNNSNFGKSVVNELKEFKELNESKIRKLEKDIKVKDEEVNKLKNIISKEELSTKINQLKKDIKKFEISKKKYFEEMEQLKQSKLQFFFEKINPILQEYMEKNSIAIIFDKKNVFMAKSDYDISRQITDLINSELK